MQKENANEKLIELKKLCEILPIKGIANLKKWCENAKIKVFTVGNKSVVHRFLVDIELDKHLINELKKKYPHKWDSLYECYQKNDKLGYIQLLNDETISIPGMTSRLTGNKSKRDEMLENL